MVDQHQANAHQESGGISPIAPPQKPAYYQSHQLQPNGFASEYTALPSDYSKKSSNSDISPTVHDMASNSYPTTYSNNYIYNNAPPQQTDSYQSHQYQPNSFTSEYTASPSDYPKNPSNFHNSGTAPVVPSSSYPTTYTEHDYAHQNNIQSRPPVPNNHQAQTYAPLPGTYSTHLPNEAITGYADPNNNQYPSDIRFDRRDHPEFGGQFRNNF